MSGVCGRLSCERYADHERACRPAKAPRDSGLEHGCGVAIIFFGLVGYAKLTGHWNTDLPKQVYLQLVPNAREQQHPMPWAQ